MDRPGTVNIADVIDNSRIGGLQINLWPRWSLGIDLRRGDKLARDLLPTEPQGSRPDNFYDLSGVAIYLSRTF